MAGRAGLRAGLIGAAVMIVVTVVNRLVGTSGALVYVSCAISLLLYAGVGLLAAFLHVPPRTPRQGATAGAIAGLISGGIAGIVGVAILAVQMSGGGGIPGVSPEQMQQLLESGIDPTLLASIGAVCGLFGGLAVGAGAAAGGGAVLAALNPD
jgi:hypothetical protein